MHVFDRYAPYYDLLYSEKDYVGEVDYIDDLIKAYSSGETKTILDLGCGTGEHAILLAQKGYRVTGVDRSDTMLALANKKKSQMGGEVALTRGDICVLDLHQRFDVAIAMFAVMGYQSTPEAFENALRNTAKHVKPGGLLIFDAWFGPAVIAQKPRDRMRIVKRGPGSVIRLTHSSLNMIEHTVDVDFTVLYVEDSTVLDCVDETHVVQFFFSQELEAVLAKTGFHVISIRPFMD
ncbi:MAG: class I SAM-dependent DNA methyltransferase, partial [Halobacteriota archaeon]